MKKKAVVTIIAACIVVPAAVASAFPFGKSWHDRADGTQRPHGAM